VVFLLGKFEGVRGAGLTLVFVPIQQMVRGSLRVPSIASRAGWEHFPQAKATVFAVKTDKVDLKADTSAAVVGFNLHFNTLARAEIMGLFKR
jgi:hypothetical protein